MCERYAGETFFFFVFISIKFRLEFFQSTSNQLLKKKKRKKKVKERNKAFKSHMCSVAIASDHSSLDYPSQLPTPSLGAFIKACNSLFYFLFYFHFFNEFQAKACNSFHIFFLNLNQGTMSRSISLCQEHVKLLEGFA